MGKSTSKKGGNKAPHRIPAGFSTPFGKPGQFVSKTAWAILEPEVKAWRKQQSREKYNEKRKAAREARRKLLVNKANLAKNHPEHYKDIWGGTQATKLKSGKTYRWHGAFIVQGGEEALKRAAEIAGSDMQVKVLKNGTADMRYEITLTPFFGKYTPDGAVENVPDHMGQMQQQLEASGATVTPLGAFWRE